MSSETNRTEQERSVLAEAQSRGSLATLRAFVRLSGPGWLQSAITLGGGSLAGGLFLGILGGTSLLWLQLVAIAMGVVMLSAISYVTLSTGERPFRAIRNHINPVLAWGWVLATIAANIIWCMPQFSLCFAALENNLLPDQTDALVVSFYADQVEDLKREMTPDQLETLTNSALSDQIQDKNRFKFAVSGMFLVMAGIAVYLNGQRGKAAKLFDIFLKCLIGLIVLCFVGVVFKLTRGGSLNWSEIVRGFVPNFSQWNQPAGTIADLIGELSADAQKFWTAKVVSAQSGVMIAAAATAVGINMTFLMPYSLLKRGWDRNFRGLSRFDLATGMAVPYVLVTSCIVIAAATQFHGKADEKFLSSDPAIMQQSVLFGKTTAMLKERVVGPEAWSKLAKADRGTLTDEELLQVAALPAAEKRIASSLTKRGAFDLSKALEPLLGKRTSGYVFGLGILGMGFSTIIILMLINGFAFCEILGRPLGGWPYITGCLIAGAVGASWPWFWDGQSKVYLSIVASSFGSMLLPIAYVTFFLLMNSPRVLGDAMPRGFRRLIWNLLMGISVLGAVAAAGKAIFDKASNPQTGPVVITVAAGFAVAVIVSLLDGRRFSKQKQKQP
ncbi:MAG: divalent metal cation transporter [Fuerstiella sp.]|nr:divalent metal cation transporter [Fuerstiella sp.]